jgi:hypothetical protein
MVSDPLGVTLRGVCADLEKVQPAEEIPLGTHITRIIAARSKGGVAAKCMEARMTVAISALNALTYATD